ncbi:hypothetical protein AVEN_23598-1 [Araneus ventricosus]|uniref:Uncharacterized protein n=1 Tax=Araneus ventricosus TaxID=182803 RepID=A0A4Y2BJV8_ARAVE|nr:hypothetical protein AVEN_23598-1 [Araneus ventricosus]
MTLKKFIFSDSHLDYFPENLGAVSEEQGERFHPSQRKWRERYQGKMECQHDSRLLLDATKTILAKVHKRKSDKRTFEAKLALNKHPSHLIRPALSPLFYLNAFNYNISPSQITHCDRMKTKGMKCQGTYDQRTVIRPTIKPSPSGRR